jgi:3-hydroxyacyl-[acyl-carrier-protein] dehydratase
MPDANESLGVHLRSSAVNSMSLEAIKSAIPHREPFLLIDGIVEQSDNRIVCRKRFTGEEFWYRGHYPEFPLTPGVLLLEAAMQAGAVLLAKFAKDNPGKVPVVSRINNVKFKVMVRPGDTITLDVTLREQLAGAFFMAAVVTVDNKTSVTFDFACKLAPVN